MTTKKSSTKKRAGKAPAQMTVAEMLETSGVPLHVWMWLERFAGGDKYALEPLGDDGPGVYQAARLVYDVLESKRKETGVGLDERMFPEEARDFVEEWLYTLSTYYAQQVWNNADAALAILPLIMELDGSPMKAEGDAAYVLLRAGVERLTTKRERRAFLHDDEGEPEPEEAENWRAAFKLSRVLADPRTDNETRRELTRSLIEFGNVMQVFANHPALVRRAFLLMCDTKPKGKVREARRLRKQVLDALDSISEGEGGDDE